MHERATKYFRNLEEVVRKSKMVDSDTSVDEQKQKKQAEEPNPTVDEGKKTRKRKDGNGSGFRKAPQAPKRFKSSYICFSMAKMQEIKEEDGQTSKVTSVAKRVADAWRALSPDERAMWDEAARKDKLRYMAEKSMYTGPWQVPSKRTKKDPSAPKRPMSAFLYFSQIMRSKVKEQNPSMRNTEVSKVLGELWQNASPEERNPHIEREAKERALYKVAISKWRKKQQEEQAEIRRQRENVANEIIASGFGQPPQPQQDYTPYQYPQYDYSQQQAARPYNHYQQDYSYHSHPPQSQSSSHEYFPQTAQAHGPGPGPGVGPAALSYNSSQPQQPPPAMVSCSSSMAGYQPYTGDAQQSVPNQNNMQPIPLPVDNQSSYYPSYQDQFDPSYYPQSNTSTYGNNDYEPHHSSYSYGDDNYYPQQPPSNRNNSSYY